MALYCGASLCGAMMDTCIYPHVSEHLATTNDTNYHTNNSQCGYEQQCSYMNKNRSMVLYIRSVVADSLQ